MVAPQPRAGVGLGAAGSRGVAEGDRVVLIDPTRAALLVLSANEEPVRHALPGPAGQLARIEDRLLVTIEKPSLLLSLAWADLSEQTRVALPAGAHGLAVTQRGDALVVSTEAAKLSAVDLSASKVRWSSDLAKLPREVLLDKTETRALVTHRVGSGASTVTPSADGWHVAPKVTAPLAGQARVEGQGVVLPDGRRLVAHGLVTDDPTSHVPTVRAELTLFSADGPSAPQRASSLALPEGTFVRALVALPKGTLLVATDDALLELPSKPKSDATARLAHGCHDVRTLVLSADGSTAHLACGDGRVANVPLPLDAAQPVTYRSANPPPPNPCEGVTLADEPISNSFKREFLGAEKVEEVLRRYHCRYPARTHLFPIATTHGKRQVWALAIGPDSFNHHRPTIFINAGHHGDELMAASFGLDALQALLEENVATGPLEDVVFVVAPLVNPDGNHHRLVDNLLGRKNGRDNDANGVRDHEDGVDLNRNYPFRWGALGEAGSRSTPTHKWFRGPSAGSEPETQGVMRLANSEKFVAAMSFHTGTLALCAPYTIPDVKNPEPDAGWIVGSEIVAQMPPHPEGPIPVKRRLYPLDGNDQDWHRHQNGTLAFLWEGAKNWLAYPRAQLLGPARASWMLLAQRFVNGPSFSLRVTDAAGRPLLAEVRVKEIAYYEGERWTTRCRDGRFDSILPKPGAYTLLVRAGDVEVERRVTVPRGKRVELDVMVPVLVDQPSECPTVNSDGGPPAALLSVR